LILWAAFSTLTKAHTLHRVGSSLSGEDLHERTGGGSCGKPASPFDHAQSPKTMPKLTAGEIRKRFETSTEFNELFEAFEHALEQHLDDIELYRQLFWNHTLTPPELCLFGEKLVKEMPALAFDVYLWLGNVFEATYSMVDNHELALAYFKKAAASRPDETAPYAEAANCYEPDINIPPLPLLIEFLKSGVGKVTDPKPLYERLAHFYDLAGNDEMSIYFRRKLDGEPPGQP
jgi:hypothetical protein